MKRDTHSFDEYRQGLLACPDRGNLLDRKAKSFEEREQEYEKAKRRIFKDMNSESIEQFWHSWSNTNSSENVRINNYGGNSNDTNRDEDNNNNNHNNNSGNKMQSNRLLRVSVSK